MLSEAINFLCGVSCYDDATRMALGDAKSPMGHVRLGLQIVYFALLLPLAFFCIFLGYRIADSGLDSLERGQNIFGLWLLFCGGVFALGGAGLLPGLGYWLLFNDGLRQFGTILGLGG